MPDSEFQGKGVGASAAEMAAELADIRAGIEASKPKQPPSEMLGYACGRGDVGQARAALDNGANVHARLYSDNGELQSSKTCYARFRVVFSL